MEGWIIGCGIAALFVRIGMALYATGLTRSKNAAGEVLRAVCDLSIAALAFWAIGAAILQHDRNGVFGLDPPTPPGIIGPERHPVLLSGGPC